MNTKLVGTLGVLVLVLVLIQFRGCSKPPTERIKTYAVRGKVTVDGQVPSAVPGMVKPEVLATLRIECHPSTQPDSKQFTVSQSDVNLDDGSFEIATYEKGDGLPVGEYALTFKVLDFSIMSRDFSPRRNHEINKRYGDSKTSEFKLVVQEGAPPKLTTPAGDLTEPLVIDLKTK